MMVLISVRRCLVKTVLCLRILWKQNLCKKGFEIFGIWAFKMFVKLLFLFFFFVFGGRVVVLFWSKVWKDRGWDFCLCFQWGKVAVDAFKMVPSWAGMWEVSWLEAAPSTHTPPWKERKVLSVNQNYPFPCFLIAYLFVYFLFLRCNSVHRIEQEKAQFPSQICLVFSFLPNKFTPDPSVPPPRSPCHHLLDSLHQGPVPGHCWLKSALSLMKTNYTTILCLISFCCFHSGSVLNRSGVH